MGILVARAGIAALLVYGVVALFQPQIVPKAPPPYDKALHFSFFFIAALFAGLSVRNRAASVMFGAILVLGGMVVEIAQGALVPGRSAEYLDAAVNAAGAATGILIVLLLRRSGGAGDAAGGTDDAASPQVVRTVRAAYLDARSRNASDAECLRAAVLAYQHFLPEVDEARARREIVRMVENLD